MDLDQSIERGAKRWLVGAGIAAILLVLFLKTADDRLSNSKSEARLGATLRELRGAQFSLPSRVTDTRQTTPFLDAPAPQAQGEPEPQHAEEHAE